jgi:hypothetical protein
VQHTRDNSFQYLETSTPAARKEFAGKICSAAALGYHRGRVKAPVFPQTTAPLCPHRVRESRQPTGYLDHWAAREEVATSFL